MLKAWGLPRPTFYERRRRPLCLRPPARLGPKTCYSDEALLAEIRRTIRGVRFHGEGHRKIRTRLRTRDGRTSMRRVLRLMRENDLLAPQRQPQPVESKRHDGAIPAKQPNHIKGIGATAGFIRRWYRSRSPRGAKLTPQISREALFQQAPPQMDDSQDSQ